MSSVSSRSIEPTRKPESQHIERKAKQAQAAMRILTIFCSTFRLFVASAVCALVGRTLALAQKQRCQASPYEDNIMDRILKGRGKNIS